MLDYIIGVGEAADILGLSPGTVKNMCASGKIEGKKIGKTWIIDKNLLTKNKEEYKMKNVKVFENWKAYVMDHLNEIQSELIGFSGDPELSEEAAKQLVEKHQDEIFKKMKPHLNNIRIVTHMFLISETDITEERLNRTLSDLPLILTEFAFNMPIYFDSVEAMIKGFTSEFYKELVYRLKNADDHELYKKVTTHFEQFYGKE